MQDVSERPDLLDRARGLDRATIAFAALAVGVACVWFLTLDARHLLPSDEGRYASIAREMLARDDWVTIRYNGLKYFEKPPLQMWMTALAFAAFGLGEWQARLWTAFSGVVGLVATAFAASRWYGKRVGVLAALVLLAAPGWNIGGHFNSLDMGLSGALAVVLAGVLVAQHPSASSTARRNWMLVAWAAMAVAVLTKGPVAIVLPGLVLVVYSALARDVAIWRRLHLGAGLLLMVAIALPWFVLVSGRNPEFLRFFFIHEHLQRFLSPIHHREGAWWYFVPQLLMGFLPWLGLAWAIAKVVRAEPAGTGLRPLLLLAVWAVAIFVFFSASSSKLPGYILPIYPALAILAACALDRLAPARWRRHVAVAIVAVLVGCVAVPFVAAQSNDTTPNAVFREFALWLAAGLGAALLGLAVAWRIAPASLLRSIALYALAFFALVTVGLRGHEAFGRISSGASLAACAAPLLDDVMPFYGVRFLDYTLPFYLRHVLTPVEAPGELEFGVQQEPQKWLPTLDAFVREWASGRRALAVMARPTYDELRSRNVPMVIVGEDARRVIVANFEGPHR
ncbi:MAG: glycosyltransferase family 39 protein [Rhizobacter sp.]|nr:glycosyltransferase family 39 protein [Rhizobacter sp.]